MALAGWHSRAPRSRAQVEARIERMAKEPDDDYINFLICLVADERPIGEVMRFDLERANGSAELGIFIGEPDEGGKGYGTDAVNARSDVGVGDRPREPVGRTVARGPDQARRAYEK